MRRRALGFCALVASLVAVAGSGMVETTSAAPETFVVTTADDECTESECLSLRGAITNANATPDTDRIEFEIESGPQTIIPQSPLPTITSPVVIDGRTQPGFTGTPLIQIDGSQTEDTSGIAISGGGSTIMGLVINRFPRSGIELTALGGNRVMGNFIGTDAAGTQAAPNGADGISIGINSPANVIGGPAIDRNVISGNSENGIAIAGLVTDVFGNAIGSDMSGTLAIGNGGAGIAIEGSSESFIGGTFAGAGNTIRFNGGAGIAVSGDAQSNSIVANAISSNGGLGIDLGADGVTPNDAGDADAGPNGLQNFPVITSVTGSCFEGCFTTISGTLSSTPNSDFRIGLFLDTVCDPSGFGEGESFLVAVSVTTDAEGEVSFTRVESGLLLVGTIVTATATRFELSDPGIVDGVAAAAVDPVNGTSEFSRCNGGRADLALTKSVDRDHGSPGDSLTYDVRVENHGPGMAQSVTVSDTLPVGVAFVSAVPSAGACGGTSVVTCTVGPLASGDAAQIRITATAASTGVLTNTATASSITPDPDLSNNSASTATTVTSADLSLAKTDAPDPVNLGDALVYTLTVRNAGPSVAAGVRVTDTLGAAAIFALASSSQGTCSGAPAVVCELGTVPPGGQATVEIRVTPRAGGSLPNLATVTSTTHDPNGANNSASATTNVTSANLSLIKADAPDPATVGGRLVYTVRVANAGPSSATAVRVRDTLAASVTFQSAVPTQGTCSGARAVVCNLGTIPAGGRAAVAIRVSPRSAGRLANVATVVSATHDAVPANNRAVTATRVTSADLAVTLKAEPGPVTVGHRLLFASRVVNRGPTVASKVVLTMRLPAGARIAADSRCAGVRTVRCSLGTLRVGGGATVNAAMRPRRAGPVTAAGRAVGADFDPANGNNEARASVAARFVPRIALRPAIGPPGFVTLAVGDGFAPSTAVILRWSPGLGVARTRTDARGRLRAPMLVFPNDLTGPRRLMAVGQSSDPGLAFAPVSAQFLVVPGRLEPAGFVQRR